MADDRFHIDEQDELKVFLSHPPSGTKLKERFIDKYGVSFTIVVFIVIASVSPILFTRTLNGFPQFHDTGQIGDTIGGLTSPVIGILNALLLWWTLRKQGQQIYEQNLQDRIHRLIDKLERDLANQSITFISDTTNPKRVTYRGKEMLFRLTDFFTLKSKTFAGNIIDVMEWKVVRHQLTDIVNLANRIAMLNLQSKTSFGDKNSMYNEIREHVNILSIMFDQLYEFSELMKNESSHARYALSAKETRHLKRQWVLFRSRNPFIIRYGVE